MEWYELAENPMAISSLYTRVPQLQSLPFVETILEERRFAQLKLKLLTFPDKAPPRWKYQSYTSLGLYLHLFHVQKFQMSGWFGTSMVDVTIEKGGDGYIHLNVASPEGSLNIAFVAFRIILHK